MHALAGMSDDRDNVIHVSFGQERGRRPPPAAVQAPAISGAQMDPVGGLYSIHDVARLFDLRPSRLRSWDRAGFLTPSGREGRRRWYTFQDLISLRVAKGLLDKGVPFRRVRTSVDALRSSLPAVIRPLAELRVAADGDRVLVRSENGAFEPVTGQLVLDFEVRDLRDDVVRVLHRTQAPSDRRGAYDLYLEGCRLDENEATLDDAEKAYRQAAQKDPSLSSALTNLANLRFRRGFAEEAEALYRQALMIDPTQPEAHYNLGFLFFERGDPEKAAVCFETALQNDPAFADAHFNLAMAYEEIGDRSLARGHWKSYLELDPSSPWADIARRHLGS